MADEQPQSESEKKKEDWMNSKWRPMMGWMYMCVCSFDFVLAPILWSLTQSLFHGSVNVQWQPLTLQGAGLFHISMGAVLGIAAYGRTQEKLSGANNGGLQQPVGTTYQPPSGSGSNNMSGGSSNGGFGSTTTGSGGFGSTNSGFGSAPTTNSFGSQPLGSGSSFGSTPSPAATGGFGSSSGFGAGTTTPAPTITTAGPAAGGKPIGPAQTFPAI